MTSKRNADNDRALIRACLEGRAEAWEQLIGRYRRLIYSIPVAYRISTTDADDIFQRVALKLFEKLGDLKRPEGLPAWLITTARRECQSFLKAARRLRPLDETRETEGVEDAPDLAEAVQAVADEHTLSLAFERLDGACRALLFALYVEDPPPSYKTISARLGRPVGSLGPTRARCLEKLRRLFLGLGGEFPGE